MHLRAAIFRVFKKTTQYSQQDSIFSRLCWIPIYFGTIQTSLLQSWTLTGNTWLYSSSEGSSSTTHLHSKPDQLIPSFQQKKTCPPALFLPYKIPKTTGESDHKTALRHKRHFKLTGHPWGHFAFDRAVTDSSCTPARQRKRLDELSSTCALCSLQPYNKQVITSEVIHAVLATSAPMNKHTEHSTCWDYKHLCLNPLSDLLCVEADKKRLRQST